MYICIYAYFQGAGGDLTGACHSRIGSNMSKYKASDTTDMGRWTLP